jgi:hypothetical protein
VEKLNMRQLILLVLSGAMLLGGLYLVLDEFLFASKIYFRFVGGGAVLAFAGGYLLWADFIAPRLGIKTWED